MRHGVSAHTVWYSDAMNGKYAALVLSLLVLPLVPLPGYGQTGGKHSAAASAKPDKAAAQAKPASPAAGGTATNPAATSGAGAAVAPAGAAVAPAGAAVAPAAGAAAGGAGSAAANGAAARGNANTDCLTGPCDYEPAHITVANPPAVVTPFLLREKIAWAASLVLVLMGYVAIMMAVSLLRKIERQTRAAEIAAEAASTSAEAALMHVQARQRAERPWLLVVVERAIEKENSFSIVAVNRGHSSAQITALRDEAMVVADEAELPGTPQFPDGKWKEQGSHVILLPGESMVLKKFGRVDARMFCGSEERLKRLEEWVDKIYLYGSVTYVDLTSPEGERSHETGWCFWYIHGRQKSGMVQAGPAAYRVHT
jgi:hypothetical protein